MSTNYTGSVQLLSHDQDEYEPQESTETTQSCLRLSFKREISTPQEKKEYRDWSLGIWNKFKSINGRRETGLYCRLQVCNSQRLIWAEICPLYTSARIGVGVKAIWKKGSCFLVLYEQSQICKDTIGVKMHCDTCYTE